jgi:hypothetical protein
MQVSKTVGLRGNKKKQDHQLLTSVLSFLFPSKILATLIRYNKHTHPKIKGACILMVSDWSLLCKNKIFRQCGISLHF